MANFFATIAAAFIVFFFIFVVAYYIINLIALFFGLATELINAAVLVGLIFAVAFMTWSFAQDFKERKDKK